jgi:microsomal dipeptidase-like Zn-dependent dipeptidase
MRYFDFHAHVILKQLFSKELNADVRVEPGEVKGIIGLCSDLPEIIKSQTHQSQLIAFDDEVIIGVVLYACERNLANEVQPLGSLLKPASAHKMDKELMQQIVSNELKYFDDFIMKRNLPLYLGSPETFNILNKQSFNGELSKDKVNIFFTIEGCHSLVNSINHISRPDNVYSPAEILHNLDVLLNDMKIPVLSVNLTHMQQSSLCNHAFGIQLTKIDPFIPKEAGMTDDGRTVAQGLFDRSICVDVKHMSYKSRLDLRNEIDAGNYNNVQPLVCTHAGFTGIPFSKYTDYIHVKKKFGAQHFYLELAKTMQVGNMPFRPGAPGFNMTTINLFDEEIVWMVKNKGVIGLCFDRRILGFVDKFDDKPTGIKAESVLYVDKEYMTITEWNALGLNGRPIGNALESDGTNCVTEDDVAESVRPESDAKQYFFRHIFLQLKHYFQACHNAGIPIGTAQKHIAMGADYDGFINPFKNISTVDDLPGLKEQLIENFKNYLRSLTDSAVWEAQLDINEFAEDFFYNNGLEFIKKQFNKM